MAKISRDVWLAQCVDGDREIRVVHQRDVNDLWKIIAGPVTVTFDVPNACPHCGGALPEAQDKAEPPKELVIEVGGTYRTRGGDRATIVDYAGPEYTYCMIGHIRGERSKWTVTGAWYMGEEYEDDLVERLS